MLWILHIHLLSLSSKLISQNYVKKKTEKLEKGKKKKNETMVFELDFEVFPKIGKLKLVVSRN